MYQETKEEFKKRIREARCRSCIFYNDKYGVCQYNPKHEKTYLCNWCAHFIKGDYQDPE